MIGSIAALTLALAQEVPPAAALTLAEAQQIARRNNERVGIARARLLEAEAAKKEAIAALYPSLVGTASYTRRSQEVTRLIGSAEVIQLQKNALAAQLALEVTLLDARALVGLEVTGRALDAQTKESEELLRALAFDVAQTFFLVPAAERLLEAAERRLLTARAALEEAERKVEAGLASRHERTRTDLEVVSARLARTAAMTGVRKARQALGFLLGEPLQDRPLVEANPAILPAARVEVLEATAKSARGDLAAMRLRSEQAEALAKEPLLRLLPVVGVKGLFIASNEAGFTGRNVDGSVAATLTWTIFDGGERYAARDARLAQAEEARLSAEAKERAVKDEVQVAWLDLENARLSEGEARTRAGVAKENAEEVRVLFSTGLANALEQVDAIASEFEASAELARQTALLRIAELSVLRAAGAWPPDAQPLMEQAGETR